LGRCPFGPWVGALDEYDRKTIDEFFGPWVGALDEYDGKTIDGYFGPWVGAPSVLGSVPMMNEWMST
jgi:hypothetical protein